MTYNQDSRPFVDLQKDSDEFIAKFVEDIEECKSLLDSKITALICDPDSIGNSVGPQQNALVEFSKAKYEIFVKMKSFMNDKEKEWQKYMSEMKKLFVDNVEIFLANTKLEIKLPAPEYQLSSGSKKSPSSKKSTAATSSIYPVINSITKSIPVLSSPLRRKEVRSTDHKESFSGFSHMDEFMDTDESETDNMCHSSSRSRKSTKLDLNTSLSVSKQKRKSEEKIDMENSALLNSSDISEDDEEINEPEQYTSQPSTQGRGHKGRITAQYRKLKANGIPSKNSSSSESQGETNELESAMNSYLLPKGRNRRGKQSVLNNEDTELQEKDKTESEDSEEINEIEQRSSRINSRKSIRASSRSDSAAISTKNSNNISNESEEVEDTETNNVVPVKGRRGKQPAKSKANAKALQPKTTIVSKKNSNNISDESEEIEETEANNNVVPVKGRRGKQATKSKANAKALQPKNKIDSKKNTNSISDESEGTEETETNNNVRPVKGHRGKQATKNEANAKALQPKNEVLESIAEDDDNVTSVVPETRRGRFAKNAVGISDEAPRMAGRSVGRKTVGGRVFETEASVSPKKVTFTAEDNLSDDLDVYAPVSRPAKSAARRKTLLPNLKDTISGADIIPGNPTRARSKRKTISGVADLSSVAPSKRLKVSSNLKSRVAAQDEEASADDNLSEINDSYSEWIPLKSIDGKVPATPAVYEVKVWRAKKTAFIGCCDSLRQKLTLHKLRQNSGHKHLDKFIERNYDDIQIRYEVVPSINHAKVEVKNRIKNFAVQHKTTPAYN